MQHFLYGQRTMNFPERRQRSAPDSSEATCLDRPIPLAQFPADGAPLLAVFGIDKLQHIRKS